MTSNPFDIAGRVIIVTGAAGTLGPGYVRSLAEAGAIVYAWDRNARLAEVFASTDPAHVRLQIVNLLEEQEIKIAVAEILGETGRIDGLINNAAMNPAMEDPEADKQFGPYMQYPTHLFKQEMDVNVVTMQIVTKHVAPVMIAQKSGSIVNVASEMSTIAHDHRVYQAKDRYKSPAYAASKAAVLGLTRQWAALLGEYGVRVNAVSPGGVKNPRVPEDFAARFGAMNMLGRMARMDEYHATMQYLLSDASSFMTGANLVIDGGKSAW
jgi:NAD(P)-dependent dehydrogenase (short-subunit alcohol dehydrogenase family)